MKHSERNRKIIISYKKYTATPKINKLLLDVNADKKE